MTAGNAYLCRKEKSRNGKKIPLRDFLHGKTEEEKTAYLVTDNLCQNNHEIAEKQQKIREKKKKKTADSVKICREINEIVKTCETRQNVPAGKVLTKPVSHV